MRCPFCRIAGGDLPADVVAETDLSMCVMDAFPLAAGHALVIPRAHRERIQDMTELESADLFALVRRMAGRVDSISGATLVAIHNGRGAGQEVPHVHVHLVPRSPDDSAGPIHGMFGGPGGPGCDAAAFEKLRGAQ